MENYIHTIFMKKEISRVILFIYFLRLASDKAMAMACLGFLTTGPRFDPLCNLCCLNSFITLPIFRWEKEEGCFARVRLAMVDSRRKKTRGENQLGKK